MTDKFYAYKNPEDDFFIALIDCGEPKEGGFSYGNIFKNYIVHEGRIYRKYLRIINPTEDLKNWDEINLETLKVAQLTSVAGNVLQGWEDYENATFETLILFSKLLGIDLTIEDVKILINKYNEKK